MYSFNKTAFDEWLKEHEITVSLSQRNHVVPFLAQIVGGEVSGQGTCKNSAIAHLANELSEEESIFINGEMLNVPQFTEALNVD